MTTHKLTHPDLPDQPIEVEVSDGAELSPEYERAGWKASVVDAEAGPETELPATSGPQHAAEHEEN